jgi:hypothetical protein
VTRVPRKLKDKFYRTTTRYAILYDAECWHTKRKKNRLVDKCSGNMYVVLGLWGYKKGSNLER